MLEQSGKGDQHVVVQIETPKNISVHKKRKLYEQLEKLESKSKASTWEKFKNLFKIKSSCQSNCFFLI
jgi:molecular chaperone DnaJ